MGQTALFNIHRTDPVEGYVGHLPLISAREILWHQALELLPDGLAITTKEPGDELPRFAYANAAFKSLSSDARGDAVPPHASANARDLASRWKHNPLWQCLKESHGAEGTFSADITHHSNVGLVKHLRFHSERMVTDSGATAHRIGVFHDITVQSNLEEALRRNERLACIGLLGAGIAHEINNPTASALLAAETAIVIKDRPDAAGQLQACLENIITSMDRCGRIVRTLLRYTRQEPPEKQACNLNDVTQQSLELARPYGQSHGANLRLILDPDIPLAPMNPLEIELVLVNLIRNAIEAGGRSVDVSVRTLRVEKGVCIEVSDSGCGMDAEQLAHVFDPLYTTRSRVGGSGLGMSIAYRIVKGHEGRMQVQSEKGKGTTVIIELPTGE